VLTPRADPFPFEAVRDLIGILRALYAATPAEHTRDRQAIEAVAREINRARAMALAHEPGTLGHAAAWNRAERATARLGELADLLTPLEPVLRAAGERVRSRKMNR
jgi:hypothetical protein